MNKFKNPQIILLLALSLLVVILFALTQADFLEVTKSSKNLEQQIQLPKPPGTIIIDRGIL